MDTICTVIDSFSLPDSNSPDPNSWGLAWDGEYMWHSQYGDTTIIYKLDLSDSLEQVASCSLYSFILGITWNGNYLCGVGARDSTFYWMNTDGDLIDSTPWQIPYPLGLYHDGVNFWNVSSDSTHGGHEAVYRSDLITGVDEVISKPEKLTVISAYPNPFNAKTTINYSLSRQSYIQLDIYNLSGQLVETLFEGVKQSGDYYIILDACDFTSGIYFVRLVTEDKINSTKLILLK